MTVQELIRMLQQCSPYKIVHIYTNWNYEMSKEVSEYEDIVEILPFISK